MRCGATMTCVDACGQGVVSRPRLHAETTRRHDPSTVVPPCTVANLVTFGHALLDSSSAALMLGNTLFLASNLYHVVCGLQILQ